MIAYSVTGKECSKFSNEKFWVFFRSIFLKFYMQVPMTSDIIYIKSKNPPRMATLTYRHFGNPSRIHPRARYSTDRRKGDRRQKFGVQQYSQSMRLVVAATRGGRMPISQGCHPRRFFLFHVCNIKYYSFLHANFQEDLPQKKNSKLFIWKFAALFLTHPVQWYLIHLKISERFNRVPILHSPWHGIITCLCFHWPKISVLLCYRVWEMS